MHFPIKLCFITLKSYPLFDKSLVSTLGGAEVQLSHLAQAMARNSKYKISIMVADYGQDDRLETDQIEIWKSLNFHSPKLRQIQSFYKIFKVIDADIYVQRGVRLESLFISLFCKFKKKRFVYMVAHDGETDGTYYLFTSWIKRKLMELVSKQASLVIVQNDHQSENIRTRCPKQRIYQLKKGLQLDDIDADRKVKKFDGIWVGRCTDWKRPELFFDLVRRYPEKKFLMICPQATDQSEYYKEIYSQSKDLNNLVFLDFIAREAIFNYLNKSKVFCFTSRQEGDWPMAVLEAAVCRLPILSFSLNYSLLIDEFEGGIVGDGRLNSFYSGFEQLLGNDSQRLKMGENAFSYISQHHDMNAIVEEFRTILELVK